jgi:Protein of unknown function (DUF1186)
MDALYRAFLDRLLELPEPSFGHKGWPDYREMGLGPEQVPLLIQVVEDTDLLWADFDTPEVWLPVHAWRALGQLRARDAVETLVRLLAQAEDNDWIIEDVSTAIGMIGCDAIPSLVPVLADSTAGDLARSLAATALFEITRHDAGARDEVAEILLRQLRKWYRQDPELNASLISDLADLGVHEAVPLMEEAFAAGRVDLLLRGDWEDVRVDMGLLPARLTPPVNHFASFRRRRPSSAARATPKSGADVKSAAKAKRKAAKDARKRNRR